MFKLTNNFLFPFFCQNLNFSKISNSCVHDMLMKSCYAERKKNTFLQRNKSQKFLNLLLLNINNFSCKFGMIFEKCQWDSIMVEIVCFQNASMYFVKQKKNKYYWMSWGIGSNWTRLNVHLIAIVAGVAADKIFEAIFKCFIRLFIDDFTVFHDHFHILLLRWARFIFTF